MSAWWAVLRHDARRHALRTILLAAFVAVGGGVVLSAFVGARREATAIDRMAARVSVASAAFVPNDPDFDWTPIAELDGVRTLQRIAIAYFRRSSITQSWATTSPASARRRVSRSRPSCCSRAGGPTRREPTRSPSATSRRARRTSASATS